MPEIAWETTHMVIIDTVINTLLGGLTLDPAGMHCPSWDDAFVSSCIVVYYGPFLCIVSFRCCVLSFGCSG